MRIRKMNVELTGKIVSVGELKTAKSGDKWIKIVVASKGESLSITLWKEDAVLASTMENKDITLKIGLSGFGKWYCNGIA